MAYTSQTEQWTGDMFNVSIGVKSTKPQQRTHGGKVMR